MIILKEKIYKEKRIEGDYKKEGKGRIISRRI